MSSVISASLPSDILALAIKKADEESRRRYEAVLTKEVARLMEEHGVAPTLHSLLDIQQEDLRSFGFLGGHDIAMPSSHSDVERSVDNDICRNGSSVYSYIVDKLSEKEMIGAPCKLRLTAEHSVTVPLWESAMAIARNLDEIRSRRANQYVDEGK